MKAGLCLVRWVIPRVMRLGILIRDVGYSNIFPTKEHHTFLGSNIWRQKVCLKKKHKNRCIGSAIITGATSGVGLEADLFDRGTPPLFKKGGVAFNKRGAGGFLKKGRGGLFFFVCGGGCR